MDQALIWIQAHPPAQIQGKSPCRAAGLLCDSKWATADQYSVAMAASGGGSNDPGDWGWADGGLTRLLSYSFLEAAKSWALEIAIPQNGRYICSTCGHIEHCYY